MLPKKHRLRAVDFKRLRGAKTFHTPHFLLRVKTEARQTAAAAVVSAAVAKNAVMRNLLRRRIYTILQHSFLSSAKSALLIVTAKKGAAKLAFGELQQELLAGLRKGEIAGQLGNFKSG